LRIQRLRDQARHGAVVIGDPIGTRGEPNDRLKPRVEQVHARQVVQDALVDAQRSGREAFAAVQLHQAEAPQRSSRRQRAPMRVREGGHCYTKCGVDALRIALGLAA